MADGEQAAREDELRVRIDEWLTDATVAARALYAERADRLLIELMERVRAAVRHRPAELAELDRTRERRPDWYQRPHHVGYIAYADRFGGTLAGVAERIPYLRELGVDLLHLMSVLRSRAGDDDGGYAVEDYRIPDPRLGSAADLESLAAALRADGISLCLDLVMNHTSATHPWAEAARAGSAYHRGLYHLFSDRDLPDAYEATLPEVFPTLAPGSFTRVEELDAWVWTTFRDYQWDLDWSNPDVVLEMVDIVLHLANSGVEVLRLDAVAFTGKRLGTNCQDQPEAHLVVQLLRAVVGMAAPATLLLAEAIVGPDELPAYLGRHDLDRRECHLAYHNQLMVQGWSMVAERRTTLATGALSRLPDAPPGTTWLTYVRCHDDIGWAVTDHDAAMAGLDGYLHRRFLAAFYRGDFPGSFALGEAFASNPRTGDERTCGMTAALCGVSMARHREDPTELDRAVDRLLLLYGLAFGYGGIPMIYAGDELGQGDDEHYRDDPLQAADSRWRHRPFFDDAAAASRHDPRTVTGRVWAGMRRLVEARRHAGPLHGAGTVEPVSVAEPAVFAWRRRHHRFGTLVGLANVAEHPCRLSPDVLELLAPLTALPVDLLDRAVTDPHGLLHLKPLQVRWLTADDRYRTVPAPPAHDPRG